MCPLAKSNITNDFIGAMFSSIFYLFGVFCVRSLYCLLTVTIDNQPNQVVHFPFGITCDDSFFLCKAVTLCSTELLRIRKGSSKANVQLFFFFDL